jgi:citrate lyase subunit beta/citryl-CoA lyase
MIEHPRALGADPRHRRARAAGDRHDAGRRGLRARDRLAAGDETLELPKRLVAFAAQAHDVPMIGILGTVADYSDPAAYQKSAERARRFGFSGGTCIHPWLGRRPERGLHAKADEVAYALKLIEADKNAAAEGRGSFSVDGKMIDIPVIERARKLVARHDAIEKRAIERRVTRR